jgi:hypothetical protein
MPHDAHGAAHALIESVAAVALVTVGLVVLGLMARRRRLGLTSSVVRSNASIARTALEVAVVPIVGLALLALLVAILMVARPAT